MRKAENFVNRKTRVSDFEIRISNFLKRQLEARCIAPQVFEAVVGAFVFMKNMHHHVGVIRDDPLARRVAIDGQRRHAVFRLQPVLDLAGDRFQVRLGSAGADDEEIGEGRNRAEVDGDDVLGFLVGGDRSAEAGEWFSFDGVDPGRGDFFR